MNDDVEEGLATSDCAIVGKVYPLVFSTYILSWGRYVLLGEIQKA
jgi:hypothetical protein